MNQKTQKHHCVNHIHINSKDMGVDVEQIACTLKKLSTRKYQNFFRVQDQSSTYGYDEQLYKPQRAD